MQKYIQLIFISTFLLISGKSLADSDRDIKFILQATNPPIGVVFEIVEGNREDLSWAIPQTRDYIMRLKSKFPDMKFAVVSHGSEQFGLLKSEGEKQPVLQRKVRSLVQDDNVPLYICGTHASWYHKDAKDFPEWVSVAPAGPAKINEYQREGYALVVIEKNQTRKRK